MINKDGILKKFGINKHLIIITLFSSFFINAQDIYYVDPQNGNDNNSGQSLSGAWKSINKANETVTAGDIVEFIGNYTIKDNQRIQPKNSGKNGSPIVYRCREGDQTIIASDNYKGYGAYLDKKSYIKIIGFKFITKYWMRALSANNIVFENNNCSHYKDNSDYSGGQGLNITNSSYCVIRGNYLQGQFKKYQDIIQALYNAHHNVIENNVFLEGHHTAIILNGNATDENPDGNMDESPRWNVIRNNYFFSKYHHGLNIQYGAQNNLIEGNFFEQSGSGFQDAGNEHEGDNDYGSSMYSGNQSIIRWNIFNKAGVYDDEHFGMAGIAAAASNNTYRGGNNNITYLRVYNNLFYNMFGLAISTGAGIPKNQSPMPKFHSNEYINNIFYNNGENKSLRKSDIVIYYHDWGDYNLDETSWNDVWENNLVEKKSELVAQLRASGIPQNVNDLNLNGLKGLPNVKWQNNISGDPDFIEQNFDFSIYDLNRTKNQFRLNTNSICIDNGDFLTVTSNSGNNSNKVKVKDARWFAGGNNQVNWDNIIDGDIIQIGNEIVKITSIDYQTNILTLDRNITWNNNSGVSFPYSGSKPDIGVFEFGDEINNGDKTTHSAPIIVSQPQNANVIEGDTATFYVSATSSDPIGYQWWKSPFISESESKIVDDSKYSGSTTNSLTIKNITQEDANVNYLCEVYNTNDRNNLWVNSNAVSIFVNTVNPFDPTESDGLKVYLEGAYKNNKMNTILNESQVISFSQPYNVIPWNFNDQTIISKFEDNYVDWLLIELRDKPDNIKYVKTAILTENGKVLNSDGTDLTFTNILSGNYYLVIKHRNHLSIMSSIEIEISNNTKINYDFTASINSTYGQNSLSDLGNGNFGMIAGDANADGVINNLDFGVVANKIPTNGYFNADLDMNGVINVLDYTFISNNILKKSNVP